MEREDESTVGPSNLMDHQESPLWPMEVVDAARASNLLPIPVEEYENRIIAAYGSRSLVISLESLYDQTIRNSESAAVSPYLGSCYLEGTVCLCEPS